MDGINVFNSVVGGEPYEIEETGEGASEKELETPVNGNRFVLAPKYDKVYFYTPGNNLQGGKMMEHFLFKIFMMKKLRLHDKLN